jgi:hypothetical protein
VAVARSHPLARHVAGGAALAVALALTAAGSAAGRSADCPPSHGRLIAHDRRVRVYATGNLFATRVYACLVGRGSRRLALLAPAHAGTLPAALGSTALAGTVVALLVTESGIDSGTTTLRVFDVASRRLLRSQPVGDYVDAGIVAAETVTTLVVDEHGAVAWIASRHGPFGSGTVLAVHAASRSGRVVTLDEGGDIAPASLRLAHGILSWSHGGAGRSAPMP